MRAQSFFNAQVCPQHQQEWRMIFSRIQAGRILCWPPLQQTLACLGRIGMPSNLREEQCQPRLQLWGQDSMICLGGPHCDRQGQWAERPCRLDWRRPRPGRRLCSSLPRSRPLWHHWAGKPLSRTPSYRDLPGYGPLYDSYILWVADRIHPGECIIAGWTCRASCP